jgi:hypothetical protein
MASKKSDLRPDTLAPFFVLTALFHGVSVASRYGDVAVHVPGGVADAIFLATIPLLFVEGFFEARLDYGEGRGDMPGWMRITSRPVKLSFTLAFVYLAIVALQVWDISIGPIDPTPPESFPPKERAMWFGIMTVGMFFPNYLAASGLLIPLLRGLTAPFRALPMLVGLPLTALLGGAAGFGLLAVLASATAETGFASLNAVLEEPAITIGLTFAMVIVPIALERVLEKKRGG